MRRRTYNQVGPTGAHFENDLTLAAEKQHLREKMRMDRCVLNRRDWDLLHRGLQERRAKSGEEEDSFRYLMSSVFCLLPDH